MIDLEPIKIGTLDVHSSAGELKMFDGTVMGESGKFSRNQSLIFKGQNGFPANKRKPLTHVDYNFILTNIIPEVPSSPLLSTSKWTFDMKSVIHDILDSGSPREFSY